MTAVEELRQALKCLPLATPAEVWLDVKQKAEAVIRLAADPRGLKRKEAADYLGIGLTKFDSLGLPIVNNDGAYRYDRADLDRHIELSKQPKPKKVA